MFNNPLDSFHDTVAEAKEEREQLDRLLTISTPRERLLVAVIALLLSVAVAWLFLGKVGQSLAFDGVLVEARESAPAGNRSVGALVWLKRDAGVRIVAGMPAVLELATADGERLALEGEVASIVALPVPEEVAAFNLAPPVSMHRLDMLLDANPDSAYLTSIARQLPAADAEPSRERGRAPSPMREVPPRASRLQDPSGLDGLAGRECRIVIELGRQSPAALFGTRRS